MKTLISLTVLAAALAGCAGGPKNEAPGAATQSAGVAAAPARITDERILADRQAMEALQQRLRRLSEAGVPQGSYPLAKAQCWLDTAKTQYHENDRSGYIEESLGESVRIIKALEADKGARAGFDTPLVARSTRLREDLWAQLDKLKADAVALACNARTVACAEVRLVRAGHAEEQTGWRAATPHVQMVEDGVRRAGQEAQLCLQQAQQDQEREQAAVRARAVAAPVVAAAPAVPAAPQTVTQVVTRETFVLLADALFRFDKSSGDQILPGGRERLAAVAERLKRYKSIQSLVVVGHTDRLGSDAYNDALSQGRAQTVRQQLEALGVKAAAVQASGRGKREPVTTSCSPTLKRAQLLECLQPDRRVTIEVAGSVQ